LHGRFGEDGTVQGALELMGIPYTGSGVMASSIAMDKVMTKRIWQAEGLPVPRHVLVHPAQIDNLSADDLIQTLGLPLIVKPAREGSSIGVSKVQRAEDLHAALRAAAACDHDILCEQCIVGDEVTCPVLGAGQDARALPVIRIVAPEGNYDYQNKYFTDDTQYLVPCGLPAQEEAAIPGFGATRLPSPGLQGMGSHRRDDRWRHAAALFAGNQHLARHDRAFAGAHVGSGRWHALRGAVLPFAGLCRIGL
jgi:D-alanine-D-alanine ligase